MTCTLWEVEVRRGEHVRMAVGGCRTTWRGVVPPRFHGPADALL